MKQKYSLHRGEMGMFIAKHEDGRVITGDLKSIQAEFDKDNAIKEEAERIARTRRRAGLPWDTFRTTSTATWVPEGAAIPVSNFTFHVEEP